MQFFSCLFVFVLPTLTIGQNPEKNSVSSNETKVTARSITFTNVTVKFTLNGLSPLDDGKVIGPTEIKQLFINHDCKHEVSKLLETEDGNLELGAYYMCKTGNETSTGAIATRILLISIMTLACVGLFYLVLRVRQASTVDGEIRWRMWRVPQLHFMNEKLAKERQQQGCTSLKCNCSTFT